MKSITARFTALVIIAILLSSAIVGGIGMITLRDKVDADAAKEINLTCVNEAQRINQTLMNIEQSVNLEVSYALESLQSPDRFFAEESYRIALTSRVENLFLDVAKETEGAVTFYFRYNAEEIASTRGFLYTRDDVGADFHKIELTDISLYSPDDDEHVGWYYIPMRNGAPTWLVPYQNKNLDIYMISYVVPVFSGDRFVGVVGMDVDFEVIVNQLKEVRAYEGNGYAALVGRDGTVYYHPQLAYGTLLDGSDASLPDLDDILVKEVGSDELTSYSYEGRAKELAFQPLVNDMDLLLVAEAGDIEAERNMLIRNLVIAALFIMAIFVAVALVSGRLLMRPLRELTSVATEVSRGNLDVELPKADASEVSTLIQAYFTTVERMRDQMGIIDRMAHTDGLTQLLNKSSYDEDAAVVDAAIAAGTAEPFALVMIDVNDLKRINDSFGHERGDAYLLSSTQLITDTFAECKVYRIGGDEFVVTVTGDDVARLDGWLEALDAATHRLDDAWEASDKRSPWEFPFIAYGYAAFDPATDTAVADVFKRADAAMYAKKQAMKSAN